MLKVGIIGAGPAGIAMAKALADAGHTITGFATTDPAKRDQVELSLPGVQVSDVATVVTNANLIVFAIPGSAISDLVTGLVSTGTLQTGQLLVSTSPDYGYEVFQSAFPLGVVPMAIHPATKFTGFDSIDRTRLKDSYIAIDAPAEAMPIVMTLAYELGGEPVHVPASARANYAEAVSVANTFTNLIVGQAIKLLDDAGISRPRNVLAGIMRATLDEALRNSVDEIDPADLLDGDLE